MEFAKSATLTHQLYALSGLHGADQDETVTGGAFNEHVEQKIHAVVQVNVGRAGRVDGDKFAGRFSRECVAGFIAKFRIGFRFDNQTTAAAPDEFAANKRRCGREWVLFVKSPWKHCVAGYNPVGWSINIHGTENSSEIRAASALTPKVSVA